jgi:xanthine/uracil permease
MIVLAAMVVSLGIALATRGLFAWGGAGEANANVASFFMMPLAWAVLAFFLLLEEQRARQWRLLAVAAAPGVLAVAAGLAI